MRSSRRSRRRSPRTMHSPPSLHGRTWHATPTPSPFGVVVTPICGRQGLFCGELHPKGHREFLFFRSENLSRYAVWSFFQQIHRLPAFSVTPKGLLQHLTLRGFTGLSRGSGIEELDLDLAQGTWDCRAGRTQRQRQNHDVGKPPALSGAPIPQHQSQRRGVVAGRGQGSALHARRASLSCARDG